MQPGLHFSSGVSGKAMDLLVDALAQVLPDVLWHVEKRFHYLGVKLPA